jgi:hypothetical protein
MISPIIGTYTSTKGQELVDFLVYLGVPKDICSKILGSQWVMKVWKDDEIYGCYLKCRELPHLNLWEGFALGDEKRVTLDILGGKAKVCSKMNSLGDGFITSIETEKYGKLTLESKFTEDGCTLSLSGKDKTVKGTWERRVKVEGSYVFEHGENLDEFFKAVGDSQIHHEYKHYKIHVHEDGKKYRLSEYIGDLGRFSNCLELDVEAPFRVPGDKEDETPSHKAMFSKTGVGKFTLMCKSNSGVQEEWKMCFSKYGVVMSGLEKSTGVTCKFFMRRFWEMSGIYKMVTMVGYERFAHAIGGLTLAEAEDISHDFSTKLVVSDLGHGIYRHQLIRKKYTTDMKFTMNKEFSICHPIIREKVTVVPTMDDAGTLCLTCDTSKGEILQKYYFNNEFCVMSVSMPDAHMRYKAIFERVHHSDKCKGVSHHTSCSH